MHHTVHVALDWCVAAAAAAARCGTYDVACCLLSMVNTLVVYWVWNGVQLILTLYSLAQMIIPFMVGIFHNIAGTTVGWFFCLFLQASWLPAVTVWNSCLRFLHSLFCHSCLWLSGNKSYHSVWHDCSSPELYSFDRHSDLLQTDLLLLESLLMLIWPQRLVIIKCQPFAYLHTSILEYCVITCHRWICLNASVIVHLINHFFNFHSSIPNLTKDLSSSSKIL